MKEIEFFSIGSHVKKYLINYIATSVQFKFQLKGSKSLKPYKRRSGNKYCTLKVERVALFLHKRFAEATLGFRGSTQHIKVK